MTALPVRRPSVVDFWSKMSTRMLPFADAATPELPLPRLLRLGLFQVTVGMAAALLIGTLNRVMIVELDASASLVACMLALPLLLAPARALIGFKSDRHRSHFGWRRVPYLWFGTLLQFGGLAILPFALLNMGGDTTAPRHVGEIVAAFSFLLIGAGLHTTQTAGLALATDLVREESRAPVVALLYVMLLVGTLVAALAIGWALRDYTPLRLIQVVQGAGALTMILNIVAIWKQEPRGTRALAPDIIFADAWRGFVSEKRTRRLLTAIFLGAAAFSAQDVLVEPYGGEVLGLSVGETTWLTALWAGGMLCGFGFAAAQLKRDRDPLRLAGFGVTLGLVAFVLVILAAPLASAPLLSGGVVLTGVGGGLFAVGTLIAAMSLATGGGSGLALGAWGAAQATAIGLAIAAGGITRDVIDGLALSGALGPGLVSPVTGYVAVYLVEVALLLMTLAALGPLAGHGRRHLSHPLPPALGFADRDGPSEGVHAHG